jgi:hypothetical protein
MAQATEPVSIDGITFDALISADETWQSDVPSYPTEEGFEVSDTIIIRPVTLDMNLYLTNTPVTWRERHGVGLGRVQDVIARLRDLYFKKTPVMVKTTDQDYTDMAIVSIGLPKKLETGTSRLIPISLRQILVTEKRTASIPDSFGRGGATGTNAGTAGTASRPVTGATGSGASDNQGDGSRGSVLYNLSSSSGLLNSRGAIGGLLGG